jgi:hypothetical protein
MDYRYEMLGPGGVRLKQFIGVNKIEEVDEKGNVIGIKKIEIEPPKENNRIYSIAVLVAILIFAAVMILKYFFKV